MQKTHTRDRPRHKIRGISVPKIGVPAMRIKISAGYCSRLRKRSTLSWTTKRSFLSWTTKTLHIVLDYENGALASGHNVPLAGESPRASSQPSPSNGTLTKVSKLLLQKSHEKFTKISASESRTMLA